MKPLRTTPFIIALLAIAIGFTACDKEEPIDPPAPVDRTVKEAQVAMGADYEHQVFFSLQDSAIVSTNSRYAWDLKFEAQQGGYKVKLNTAKKMGAHNMGDIRFDSIVDPEQVNDWEYDFHTGDMDRTAVGEWGQYQNNDVVSNNHVYLLDLGEDLQGNHLGYQKIKFESMVDGKYSIRYANMDNTKEHTVTVDKESDKNFVYLSLDGSGAQKTIEPASNSWELLFTMYTHIFYESPDNIPQQVDTIPYLVTGVLTNPARVSVALDTVNTFNNITIENIDTYSFNDNINAIGYDWKLFDFYNVSYTIVPGRTYVIKTEEGAYYKLQFTDFYNDQGLKGHPKFEYARL